MVIFRYLAALTLIFPISASAQNFGVNLGGCYASESLCPNKAEVDWWITNVGPLIRLPFKDSTPISAVNNATNLILERGGTVVQDRHDYKWTPPQEQVSFWRRRLGKFRNNPRVIIDLHNEPRGFNDPIVTNDFLQWARDTRATIAGLRAAGIKNVVAVEWPGSSAAFRFDKRESSKKPCISAVCALDRLGGLGDSNVLYETHMYFDHGSSGTHRSCVPFLVLNRTRVAAAQRGLKLFLGEAAFGSWQGIPASCQEVGARAVAEIKANPQTWFGVTWWGAGREWKPSYLFAISPKGHVDQSSSYLRLLSGRN